MDAEQVIAGLPTLSADDPECWGLESWPDGVSPGMLSGLGELDELGPGGGNGLMDLSLQADDTSLGGILDEIYTQEGQEGDSVTPGEETGGPDGEPSDGQEPGSWIPEGT